MPGKVMIFQLVLIYDLPAFSILPHSAVGGWTPIPTKLKPAAERMAEAMLKVACTIIGALALGSICLKRIRAVSYKHLSPRL